MYFTEGKGLCTGCTACVSICPVNCITMESDEEGFLYPLASDKCIKCGKCQTICPRINKIIGDKTIEQKAYVAISKNNKIWKRSASGGAFTEICKAYADKNTLICGAAWDGLKVKHICVIGVNNIEPLCKSKYIASELGDTFKKIKNHLVTGNKVIFCGTPCQVAGLRAFIGNMDENLLLIDLICHGVGSPVVFEECVKLTGKQLGIMPIKYGFREKPQGVFITRHLSSISDDKKTYYVVKDQYNQLFLEQTCIRPCCGSNCIYRDENRQGDFTIADFNGSVDPKLSRESSKNKSCIISNTKKALDLLPYIIKNMKVEELPIEDVKKFNPLFYKQTWFSSDRDSFFNEFCDDKKNLNKWVTDAQICKISIKRRIYNALPYFIKMIIKRVHK